MELTTKNDRKIWWVGLAFTALCCALLASLHSFRTMPIAEGWYTEYAWQINHGNLPYRDFEYLFFPLYIYLIAGFTQIFGYSILALRIFGIVIFTGIGAAMYILLSKFFDKIPAMLAAISATVYLQSELVQLYYDYIRVHDLLAIIAAIFMVEMTRKALSNKADGACSSRKNQGIDILASTLLIVLGIIGIVKTGFSEHTLYVIAFAVCILLGTAWLIWNILKVKKNPNNSLKIANAAAIWCGIFAALECMVKQSNGTLMILMIFVYLVFCGVVLKNVRFFAAVRGYVTGLICAFGVMVIGLLLTDSFYPFIESCFGVALSAKGGAYALFRWIPGALNQFFIEKGNVLTFFLLLDILVLTYYRRKEKQPVKEQLWLIIALAAVQAAVIWLMTEKRAFANVASNYFNGNLVAFVFFSCTALFAWFAFYQIKCRITGESIAEPLNDYYLVFPVLGVVFAQGYGVGLSGGLVESQVAIGFAVLMCALVHFAFRSRRVLVTGALVASLILCTGTFAARKSVQNYTWWGLTQDSLASHTETVDVPLLKGIRVRNMDKLYYETIYRDVVENTQEGDQIFCFPHCSVIYTMTNRHSDTYTKVQWFDQCSVDSIYGDVELLRSNNPKVVVYVDVPESVYQGHESSFLTYQTRYMKDFLLNELCVEGRYEMLNDMDLGNGYRVKTYRLIEQ